MPKKSDFQNVPRSEKAERFNDIKFIQYELDKEQQAACKAWISDGEALDDAALKFCEQGYTYSTKWDSFGKCFAVFARSTDSSSANSGYLLTGRGSTPFKALRQCLYKHFIVFDELWGPAYEQAQQFQFDD